MKKFSLYILLAAFIFPSCKKYLDVNENPNSPTTAPINGLLGQVTYQSALDEYRIAYLTTNYVQYFASPNPASASDIYESIDASGTWTSLYNTMTDIYDMQQLGANSGSSEHEGVAKILMALNLKFVHDIWGDAPFTEAFTSETITPSYDGAQAIYAKCLSLLDEGIALLQQPTSAFNLDPSLDFIHHGSKSAWIKTAYALKARFLSLVSKLPSYNPDAVLTALNNAYTSNSDDAQITTFSSRNPWAQVALNNAALLLDGFLSTQYIDMMDGTIYGNFDPRLPMIATLTQYSDYRGTPNGVGRIGTGIDDEESYLKVDGYYSSTNSPLIIISYAETKFLEAEAKFRKGTDMTGAYNAYLDGIRANMNKMGVSAVDRDAYVNSPIVSVGSANLTLALIFKEKYKALFLSSETWNDARRTNYNYSGFSLPANAVLSTYIRRLDYPSVETSRNGSNVPTISGLDQKFWWDQ
ncbi:MAG: SusD/RagB family nutrient-binding outer membrane lipoprotein [Chitinophagaceae bacterium]|nr:SusD/RagB family nutrient-binding outer membrane lipoprotein [Chitinophagaceae bacterium]MCB0740900.1 SusD/RagB family nutrient-binding outer membrane lipoprotein [Chitinophagaceae bacterium]